MLNLKKENFCRDHYLEITGSSPKNLTHQSYEVRVSDEFTEPPDPTAVIVTVNVPKNTALDLEEAIENHNLWQQTFDQYEQLVTQLGGWNSLSPEQRGYLKTLIRAVQETNSMLPKDLKKVAHPTKYDHLRNYLE